MLWPAGAITCLSDWVKKGLEDSEAHMNVSSCPQGPPQESSGRQSCMMQAGRSPAVFPTQPWRLYILYQEEQTGHWKIFSTLKMCCLKELSSSCLTWILRAPLWSNWVVFILQERNQRRKRFSIAYRCSWMKLWHSASSPLVSLWHHAMVEESHTEISHRYLLSTYSVPDTQGAKPSACSGAYCRKSVRTQEESCSQGPDSLIYLMWWSVGYPVSWGLT